MKVLNRFGIILMGFLYFMGCSYDSEECFSSEPTASVSSLKIWNVFFEPLKGIELLENNDTILQSDFALWIDIEPNYFQSNFSGCQVPLLQESISDITLEVTSLMSIADSANQYFVSPLLVIEGNSIYPISDLETINEIFRNQFRLFIKPEVELEKGIQFQFNVNIKFTDNRQLEAISRTVIFK